METFTLNRVQGLGQKGHGEPTCNRKCNMKWKLGFYGRSYGQLPIIGSYITLEAQLPIYRVPVLGALYRLIVSITQELTMWVPALLGLGACWQPKA